MNVKTDWNYADIEKLAGLQCTNEEIANFIGVASCTFYRRLAEDEELRKVVETGRSNGRVSVRRSLYVAMTKGSVPAAIFLAKNVLGYRDIVKSELSVAPGQGTADAAANEKLDPSKLTEDELRNWLAMMAKMRPEQAGETVQ